jgi:hypothetical protein
LSRQDGLLGETVFFNGTVLAGMERTMFNHDKTVSRDTVKERKESLCSLLHLDGVYRQALRYIIIMISKTCDFPFMGSYII